MLRRILMGLLSTGIILLFLVRPACALPADDENKVRDVLEKSLTMCFNKDIKGFIDKYLAVGTKKTVTEKEFGVILEIVDILGPVKKINLGDINEDKNMPNRILVHGVAQCDRDTATVTMAMTLENSDWKVESLTFDSPKVRDAFRKEGEDIHTLAEGVIAKIKNGNYKDMYEKDMDPVERDRMPFTKFAENMSQLGQVVTNPKITLEYSEQESMVVDTPDGRQFGAAYIVKEDEKPVIIMWIVFLKRAGADKASFAGIQTNKI